MSIINFAYTISNWCTIFKYYFCINISDLVKKTDFNSKIIEVEGKIPSIGGLVTNSALTAVENKISDVSGLATNSALIAVENKYLMLLVR